MPSKINKIVKQPSFHEFVRFCVVGVIAVIVHYGVYLLLLWMMGIDWRAAAGVGIGTNVAYAIGYIVSLCCNLLLTAYFTFKKSITWKRSGGFIISHIINYLIHLILLNVFLYLGVAEWLAPFLVLLIAVPVNFVLVRIAFKKL